MDYSAKENKKTKESARTRDEAIVRLFQGRKEEAIAETLRTHGSLLHRFAARFLTDERDCEETVNDALLAAWNAIPPHVPENLPAFLVTLVRRAAISRLRSLTRAKDVPKEHLLALEELEEVLPDRSQAEDEVLAKELADSINAFLQTRTAREKTVFLLRYYASCSVKEISERLALSRSSVEKELARLRLDLKEKLESEGYTV